MKRRFFIRTLGVLGLASLLPKQSSGSWASLASNQLVSGSNLQDAIDTGVFVLRPGHTITKTTQIITVAEVQVLLNCKPIPLAGNRGVRKADIVPLYPVASSFNVSIVSATDACEAGTPVSNTVLVPDPDGLIGIGSSLWVRETAANSTDAFTWLEPGQGIYYWVSFNGQWYKMATDSSVGTNGDTVEDIGDC